MPTKKSLESRFSRVVIWPQGFQPLPDGYKITKYVDHKTDIVMFAVLGDQDKVLLETNDRYAARRWCFKHSENK